MAATLGEKVGETIGLRVRLQSLVSKRTRIEVVTEGVFTRQILDDPSLEGVAGVLFDEFHERSLDADLGLALALDAQRACGRTCGILVMSATLDGARVRALLGDAPLIESEGRAFPVATRYVGRHPRARIEDDIVRVTLDALASESGSILAFLPGQGEIRRVAEMLAARVGERGVDIAPLYGALDSRAQDLAVQPAPAGRRKIVLATSIAETSLTIEGVRVVIDSGLMRVPCMSPTSASPGWRPFGSAGPMPTSGAGGPGASSRGSATGCGRRRRTEDLSLTPRRKFSPPIFPASCSIARSGASPTLRGSPSSIRRRAARSCKRAHS